MLALIDCNSFYCNCERLFRPELRNKPVVVLSNNDGCIISRTPEAKALGIAMGAPYHHVRDFCKKNNVHVFSANFALYTNLSARVMMVLKELAPKLEVYSVDEAFADLSGIKDPHTHAIKMHHEVQRLVGIPVAIGVAPSKTLTKIAAEIAKKNKLSAFSLSDQKVQDEVLQKLSIADVWGVSHGRLTRLQMLGIRTAYDLREFPNRKLLKKHLTKIGEQIQDELRGLPSFSFGELIEKKKSIMSSRSFGKPLYNPKLIAEAIACHISDICEELRRQESVAKRITLFIRSNPFQESSAQFRGENEILLHTPSDNTFELIRLALQMFKQLWRPNIPFHKVGVIVHDLQDKNEHALDLFSDVPDPRIDVLLKTMDDLNYKQGARTLRSLACGTNGEAWAMRRNMLSPRYTTSWRDLPLV